MDWFTISNLYDAAWHIYVAVMAMMALAIVAGFIADHAGTQRISLVLAAVMAVFLITSQFEVWDAYEQRIHIFTNGLAIIPLLVRPSTSRQQHIAAWFVACALVHSGFYFLVPESNASRIVEWYASISIDAVQAVLVLIWSGPHVGKALRRYFHRVDGLARPDQTARGQ